MALQHAQALDVIDVGALGSSLPSTVTHSLLKTPALQLMRLVLRAGASLPEHSVAGAITVHCIEGEAVLSAGLRQYELQNVERSLETREPRQALRPSRPGQ